MKYNSILILSLICLLLNSCQKAPQDLLVGTWEVSSKTTNTTGSTETTPFSIINLRNGEKEGLSVLKHPLNSKKWTIGSLPMSMTKRKTPLYSSPGWKRRSHIGSWINWLRFHSPAILHPTGHLRHSTAERDEKCLDHIVPSPVGLPLHLPVQKCRKELSGRERA